MEGFSKGFYGYQTVSNATEAPTDFRILAQSYLMYKIGVVINKFYFPVLVPIGATGNILSFLVMTQKHNRHSSFSLYIAILAVADTVTLFIALFRYINAGHDIDIPPNQKWYCRLTTIVLLTSTMWSVMFIISMTFDRFYSIIRPHKAASFNTVKRAKITIICIITLCSFYNIPHIFSTTYEGRQCTPYGGILKYSYGQFYYWLSTSFNFIIPFISLLIMNSFIINILRTRSMNVKIGKSESQGQGQGEGQNSKIKNSEKQIYIMLLLVTFAFLILTTPVYVMVFYINFVEIGRTPRAYAEYYLFYNVGQKLFYANYAINFFLYVMSGQKFRNDLVNLFRIGDRGRSREQHTSSSVATSVTST